MKHISMLEPFSEVGRWWPAGNPDAVRHGTLRFDPAAGIRLELIDAAEAFDLGPGMHAVLGLNLSGQEVSLIDCFVVREQGSTAGTSVVELVANAALVGIHRRSLSELCVSEAHVRVRGMTELLSAAPGIEPTQRGPVPPIDKGHRWWFCLPPARTRRTPISGSEIELLLSWTQHHEPLAVRRELTSGAAIKLDDELAADGWGTQWLRPLQELVAFSTMRPALLESVCFVVREPGRAELVSPAIRRAAPDSFWERSDVYLLRRQTWGTLSSGHLSQPLVSPEDVDFELFAAAFFGLYRDLDLSAPFLFAALNAPAGPLETQLGALASGAEAFHRTESPARPLTDAEHTDLKGRMLGLLDDRQRRIYESPIRYANAPSQRKRFEALGGVAKRVTPELVRKPKALAGQLADTRNLYTHLDEQGPDAVDGERLLELVQRLQAVMRLHVLLACGLGDSTVDVLINRADLRHGLLRSAGP